MTATGRELMQPQQIGEICEGRDKTIALWLGLYDHYHAVREEAGRLSIAGTISLSAGYDQDGESLTRAFVTSEARHVRDRETGKTETIPARDAFERILTATVDRRCWTGLMDHLGFDQLLDNQARKEFHDSLRTNPAPFTPEACAATFGNIWTNRREIYLRGIANVFSALDRRFRSHNGFKIGARLIIDSALNEWGSWSRYDRRDTLRDVERVFREIEGKPPVSEALSIAAQVSEMGRNRASLPDVVHGEYFRVRVFKNGNLHLWFERDDLTRQVNLLLAEYYGEAIGDSYEETQADDAPAYHITPAKNFGAFFTSEEVAEKVIELALIGPEHRVLEPSAGAGALARPARDRGARVTCVEVQPGLAHELRVLHGFTDITQADFLTLDPDQCEQFDRIVMNPPFDRGRDCDHVRHAYEFLKPGGILVAIMAARAEHGEDKRHKALHRLVELAKPVSSWRREKWHDLPAGSFAHAGTNVNTVMLAIRKPE